MRLIKLSVFYHRGEKQIKIDFPYSAKVVTEIKATGAKWSNSNKCWYILYSQENYKTIISIFKREDDYTLQNIPDAEENKPVQIVEQRIQRNNFGDEETKILTAYDAQLILKGYSINTRKNYRSDFKRFLKFNAKKDINRITIEEIKQYLLHGLEKEKISASAANGRINAIKFYYEKILKRPRFVLELPRPQRPKQLPNILNIKEVLGLLSALDNLKHKAILYLAYSAGLRISEVINLKISDIDSGRMLIHVRGAKGDKDRMVVLSTVVLENLRLYFKKYKPKIYLFPGQNGLAYSARSAQLIFHKAKNLAGIIKPVTFHSMRHSYATHLLDNGTDIRFIKELLGHTSLRTTERYTHVTIKSISKIESPLDKLMRDSL